MSSDSFGTNAVSVSNWLRDLLEQGQAQGLQDCVGIGGYIELFPDDCHQHVHRHGVPLLVFSACRIFRDVEEGLDAQALAMGQFGS